jgi:HlyD family secretion protein
MELRGNSANGLKKKLVQTAIVMAVGIALLAGCSSQAKEQEGELASTSSIDLKRVKTAEIVKVQISAPLEQVADVVASAQVDIVAKAGGDLQEIVQPRGAKVNKGDIIAILEDTDVRLQQEQALLSREGAGQALTAGKKQWQLNVEKMEQALTEVTKAYNKTKNDYDQGLADKTQLDQAESAYTNMKSELAFLKETSVTGLELQVKSAELSVAMTDRLLANHEIIAPIDGILTDLNVQAGMTVNPGYGIGRIQQIDPIKISALLTAQSAKAIKGKSQLAFYVPGQAEVYTGEITYLADVIDSQTNAYELNLSIANSDLALKPGMKVQVRLTEEEEEQVVAVPTLSIVREGPDSYVYLLNGNQAEKRKVVLGRLNELNQEIISGVSVGEQLIISGQHQLQDGEQVQVAQ